MGHVSRGDEINMSCHRMISVIVHDLFRQTMKTGPTLLMLASFVSVFVDGIVVADEAEIMFHMVQNSKSLVLVSCG